MKKRIPNFNDFTFETYSFKDVCRVESQGPVSPSCDIIFNSTDDDTFELIDISLKDIVTAKGLTLSFYKKRNLDEDVAIVERIIKAYQNHEKIPPIIIDTDNTIMDGYHRYVAAKEHFGRNGKIKAFKKNKI